MKESAFDSLSVKLKLTRIHHSALFIPTESAASSGTVAGKQRSAEASDCSHNEIMIEKLLSSANVSASRDHFMTLS